MTEVRRVVRAAGRRLFFIDTLHALAITLSIAMGLAILARVAERVLGLSTAFAPWWQWIFVGGGALAVVSAIVWAFVQRRRPIDVAQEVDERADLRESLSSAMYLERSTDAWSQNVVESARRAASGVKVPAVVPVQAPRPWPVPFLTLIAGLIVWYAVPELDLLKVREKEVAQEKKQQEVLAVKAEVQEKKEKLAEMLRKANVETGAENDDLAKEQPQLENDPEAIRRAAIKELTQLTNKLEESALSEKAMQSEALKEAMEQLRQPGPGPMQELSKSLSKGDFASAKAQLEQLSNQLAQGDLNKEQKEQLQKQADNMAKQLEKLAESQAELAKKLQDAGLDKKTAEELAKKAGDPAQLKDALEKAASQLSEQQKQDLMKMAQACQKAGDQCKSMSEGMSKMAQGMSQDGLQNMSAEGMADLAQALSEAEMTQSDMENLSAALNEAKDQLAKLGGQCKGGQEGDGEGESEGGGKLGQWRQASGNKGGQGQSGPQSGQGNGDGPEAEPADFELAKKKVDIKTEKGPIIGSRLVYGDQVKGESIAEFSAAVAEGERTLAEGIDSVRLPRDLEGPVKNYFGNLKKKAADGAKPAEAKPEEKK
ncbi:MAG TPA: hypothetical protein VD971_12285 [Phycisphaerales bacterium]|nr:hypothetical protein [Phycisphaerales bacterium]